MNRLAHSAIIFFFLTLGASSSTFAQLSATVSAGYGIPSQAGSGGMWGGGIGIRYYLSPTLTVGARIRGYLESVTQEGISLTGRLTSVTVPVMATVEYQILLANLHPYVGLEAGIIQTALITRLDYNGLQAYNETTLDTKLGVAPKIGVGYNITQGMTLFAEGMYTVGFGKDRSGSTQFDLRSSSRFPSVHAGVSIIFGNRF